MRQFVISISKHAPPSFIIIPQNGQELLTNQLAGEERTDDYLAAIDATGREDLFYGYSGDNEPTPAEDTDCMCELLDIGEAAGIRSLVTDYCWTKSKMDDSYRENSAKGYLSFAADSRGLDTIPAYPAEPYGAHSGNVTSMDDVKNFLYLIDPSGFQTKDAFLAALENTDYDLLIIDAFYDDTMLIPEEVQRLRTKRNGGTRLVVSYMSIGEAEDYRYYWNDSWDTDPPFWLGSENPHWEGNYKVRYWDSEWQSVIFGSDDAYLDRIIASGFDGVYLDIIDAFEYYEQEKDI